MVSSLDFVVEQHRDTHVVCMDDRPLESGLSQQIQIAGGAIGIATDLVAAAMMKGGDRLPLNAQTVDVYAGIISKAMRRSGIELVLHEHCAAEEALPSVVAQALDMDTFESVFATVQVIAPEVSETSAARAWHALGVLSAAHMVRHTAEAAHHMEREAGIERVALIKQEHASSTIIANHGENLRFDTAGAWSADVPAYHISFGAYPAILQETSPILPATATDVLAVSAMRHAATASRLPLPSGAAAFRVQTL